MVRVLEQRPVVAGSFGFEYRYSGLSTDTKPTGGDIVTGSLFHEVDTGDVYAYDESSETWMLNCSLGGGS